LVYIACQAFGILVPIWFIQVLWIVAATAIIIAAIKIVASL